MSYEKTQRKALETIQNNQSKHYDNLQAICLIFEEIGKLEKAYSEGLAQIEKKIKMLNDFGTLGVIFNMLVKNIKLKKDQHLILERIIRTIFNKDQLTPLQNDQFRNQIQSHKEQTDFGETVKCIENAKNEYHGCLNAIEKAFSENLLKMTNVVIEPEEFERQKAKFIEKEMSAKSVYCLRINKANETRDKFESQMNLLLKECQKTEEKYLLICSNNISSYYVNEREVYKKLTDSACEIKNVCDALDVNYEIEQYCKSNNRHGPPPSFSFEVYSPSFSFFSSLTDKQQTKSHRAILKDFFKKNFGYYPPEGVNDQSIVDNYRKLENFVTDIWIDKCDPHLLKTFEQLFEEKKMRNWFLKMINQSRLKLSTLSAKSFNILIQLMRAILNESIKAEPYCFDSIHLVVILSQTFYMKVANDKGEFTQVFLQSEIMKEKLWQSKAIWEGLIEYNFETEMSNDLNVITLSSDERAFKEQSSMVIILTTFNFIMSSFGFDVQSAREVIAAYCARYNISEENIKSID